MVLKYDDEICMDCFDDDKVELITKTKWVIMNGERFELKGLKILKCKTCGTEAFLPDVCDDVWTEALKAYRVKYGKAFVEEEGKLTTQEDENG